MVKLPTFRRIC